MAKRFLVPLMLTGLAVLCLLSCSDGLASEPHELAPTAMPDPLDNPANLDVQVYLDAGEEGPGGACEFWRDGDTLHADAYWDRFPLENENGERAGFDYRWILTGPDGAEEFPGSAGEEGRHASLLIEQSPEPETVVFELTPLYGEDVPAGPDEYRCDVRRPSSSGFATETGNLI